MVARKDARTYHCTERATVRKPDHYMQGRLRNWLCDDHAAQCNMPVEMMPVDMMPRMLGYCFSCTRPETVCICKVVAR